MKRVNQLFVKNIGPFDEEIFDFSIEEGHPDIHIFTGKNGTGKSTLLHSLASAFDWFEKDHEQHRSNNLFKKFKLFDEDNKSMAESYIHINIEENKRILEKVCIYGCKSCKNIHQNFEKKATANSSISKIGNSYKTIPSNKELLSYKSAINATDLTNKKFSFAAFGYSGYRLLETENIEITDKEKGNPLHLALEFNKRKDDRAFSISNWIASRWSKAAIEEISGNKEVADKIRFAINRLIECINDFTNNDYTIKIETNPWRIGISYCGSILEFDVLPDGLRSILSWLGDLLMRLDAIPWENNSIAITEQNIILFLDEIEVHLHPTWQDKILPLLKEILPNAQIFITTHSPFILNSIDNAKIYMLNNENCETKLEKTVLSETGDSYQYVYENILYTKNIFGYETIKLIERFNEIDKEIVLSDFSNENEFIDVIEKLKLDGDEVMALVSSKLLRLKRVVGKDYFNGKINKT